MLFEDDGLNPAKAPLIKAARLAYFWRREREAISDAAKFYKNRFKESVVLNVSKLSKE